MTAIAATLAIRRSGLDPAKSYGCEMRTKSGKPCSAPAIHGTSRCFSHTGFNARLAGMRGGGVGRVAPHLDALAPFDVPKNTEDVLRLLAQTISDVRTGAMDPRTAGALCIATPEP